MAKEFNRKYDELKKGERRQVDKAVAGLRLRVEQGSEDYGSWYGTLYQPHKPTCKDAETETPIVSVLIETRASKIDDTEYVVGDYMIRTERAPLGAPVAYTVDIPFEIERAFVAEAAQRVVHDTWNAVAAIVPSLTEVAKPDYTEVSMQGYGLYARRPGSTLPIRLI